MTIGAYVEMEGKALRALKSNSDRWVSDSYKLFWKECTAFLRKHHIPTKVMTEQGGAPVTDPLLFPHSIVKPLQPSCYSRPDPFIDRAVSLDQSSAKFRKVSFLTYSIAPRTL